MSVDCRGGGAAALLRQQAEGEMIEQKRVAAAA